LTILVHLTAEIGRSAIREKLLAVASAYRKAWKDIELLFKTVGDWVTIFSLEYCIYENGDYEWDEEEMISLRGTLQYNGNTRSFSTQLVEVNESTGESRILLNQPFFEWSSKSTRSLA
jgi:hypothetical protein